MGRLPAAPGPARTGSAAASCRADRVSSWAQDRGGNSELRDRDSSQIAGDGQGVRDREGQGGLRDGQGGVQEGRENRGNTEEEGEGERERQRDRD